MRVAFLGLGLIGGSIARALREQPVDGPLASASLVAWSPEGRGPAAALARGTIDEAAASPDRAVAGADLVILAAPPIATLALVEALAGAGRLGPSAPTVITDVASTKRRITERAAGLGLRFVGGHPMAGRELSGFGAADPELFRDRPWVVCDPAGDEPAAALVEALARACRALPMRMTAGDHDAAVAGISHLPLVAAVALVESVVGAAGAPDRSDWASASRLAASGWRDMTRLARGDVEMGAGILATNGPEVATRLRALRDAIDDWIAMLETPGSDETALAARLFAARDRLARPDR
jgi:prephenate dehydrogenase